MIDAGCVSVAARSSAFTVQEMSDFSSTAMRRIGVAEGAGQGKWVRLVITGVSVLHEQVRVAGGLMRLYYSNPMIFRRMAAYSSSEISLSSNRRFASRKRASTPPAVGVGEAST